MSNDREPGDEFAPAPASRNRYHPGRPHDFLDVEAPATKPSTSPAGPGTDPDPERPASSDPGERGVTDAAEWDTSDRCALPRGSRQKERPGRPGDGGQSDLSGKTHEGITGVSGETGVTENELGDEEAT